MGLFDFFKSDQKEQEQTRKDKYWSLITDEGEVIDPTMEQINTAVKHANPTGSIFATLAYNHSGLEIESIQAISDGDGYRFEALTDNNKMYVKDGITSEEARKLFEHFFNYQRVSGFRSWPIEKY